MRARLKAGQGQLVLCGSCTMAPAHPEYFEVSAADAAAVEGLVLARVCEYEIVTPRGPAGAFTSPEASAAGQFARRGPGRPRKD